MEKSLFPWVKNRLFTQLTGINEAQEGLKSSLQACGMKRLAQGTQNDISWPGIIHTPSKEY